MNINNASNKLISLFRFDQVIFTILFIVLPGVILDGLVEYNIGGFSLYFIRAIITFSIITLSLFLYRVSLMKKSNLLTISVYTIILTMMISLTIGSTQANFQFEPFFLKIEVIVALLVFAVGMLVHFRHIIVLLGFNASFIIYCLVSQPQYPAEKLAFYGIIVGGGGLMAYFSQRILIRLSKKIKEANKLIKLQNTELKEMNQSKDDLFRIIGHDLRTPFHQLRSLVDMIDEADNPKEKTEIKELLKVSADRGNQLLEELLEWSTTYKQQSQVALEKQDISVIVERVFEFSDFKRKTKEINLINRLPENLEIPINSTMMETVIRNLVANAIKFSHRGSQVIVKSDQIGRQVRIAVIDKGVGMCKDKLGGLFSGDKNQSTIGTEDEKGIGYGLNIAKKLVEKQNGIFEIHSEHNKGTTISMYFPTSISA